MAVLGLCGLESLKILDGSKGQDIDNIQIQNFDRSDRANNFFTLDLDRICKPI